MNRIERIKAAQVAAAEESGNPHPYRSGEPKHESKPDIVISEPRREGRMAKIKAAQKAAKQDRTAKPVPHGQAKGIGQLADYQDQMQRDEVRIKAEKTLEDKTRIKQAVLHNYLPFVAN